ncbi:MAG: hypothetical protein AVDCRST_MAG05-3414, partial [uncultured Rubrobacteraceae bacterium]
CFPSLMGRGVLVRYKKKTDGWERAACRACLTWFLRSTRY